MNGELVQPGLLRVDDAVGFAHTGGSQFVSSLVIAVTEVHSQEQLEKLLTVLGK